MGKAAGGAASELGHAAGNMSETALKVDDTGTFDLPANTLHADRQQARRHTLRLVRTNSVTPAGAVDGSTWEAAVENDVDVTTSPLPF